MAAGPGADRISGVLLVLNDITAVVRLHTQQQELLMRGKRLYQEKMEGLDRLARAVAHEIRNPVTTIGGLTQRLFHDKDLSSRECQYLRRILDCTNQLETLVREVRAYADMPPPRLRPVDLGVWLGQVAKEFAPKAKAAQVKMTLAGAVGRAGEVAAEADGDQLRRVLFMMLENAVESMPGGGELRLELDAADNTAAISLSDTGKGIDPADMPYLFDPFFTTKTEAVGMSLAIAKRVAVEHEGDLIARPRPEGGTTFILTVPQKPLSRPDQVAEIPRPPSLR
jgi:signal transduction histidine kinase